MIINAKEFGKTHRIRYDSTQYTVERRIKNKKGGFTWVGIGYYGNIGGAVKKVIKDRIYIAKESDIVSLEDYVNEFNNMSKTIINRLNF